MIDFVSNATVLIAAGCGVFSLVLTFYVGYLVGKSAAEKTTYAAINELVDSWNKLLRRMKVTQQDPKITLRAER